MLQITISEFKEILLSQPLDEVVMRLIFRGSPYAFQDQSNAMTILHNHLRNNLGIQPQNIVVVGSGKTGFSLNPETFPRQFSDESDIDVVVVDEALFDRVWTTILKWHYPRRLSGLASSDRGWAGDRKKDVYWGWIHPDRITFTGLTFPDILKPLRDFSSKWFNTFKKLSLYEEFAGRNVNGRLYRTWDHATLYHVEGLRMIKETVSDAGKGA
jgi:hypothetical protein